mmetsp:Transcript_85999/g.230020  ORF Transcript_85999/g.230020 Transcript_85999/m.230020 type:complete len:320 (+) Transcript_85999:180-1139(+)
MTRSRASLLSPRCLMHSRRRTMKSAGCPSHLHLARPWLSCRSRSRRATQKTTRSTLAIWKTASVCVMLLITVMALISLLVTARATFWVSGATPWRCAGSWSPALSSRSTPRWTDSSRVGKWSARWGRSLTFWAFRRSLTTRTCLFLLQLGLWLIRGTSVQSTRISITSTRWPTQRKPGHLELTVSRGRAQAADGKFWVLLLAKLPPRTMCHARCAVDPILCIRRAVITTEATTWTILTKLPIGYSDSRVIIRSITATRIPLMRRVLEGRSRVVRRTTSRGYAQSTSCGWTTLSTTAPMHSTGRSAQRRVRSAAVSAPVG